MILGFGNNVVSSLAADITSTQTSVSVMPGAGASFAALLTSDMSNDSTSHGTYGKVTITDAEESVFEICHLTAVSGDTLTVVRGQEGTTAKSWSLNDKIANFATRGSENAFVQVEQLQAGDYTAGTAAGSENALTLALPTTFFNNSATAWELKAILTVMPTLTNTGPATLQLTMGGKVLGIFPLYKGDSAELDAGDIIAGTPVICAFNSAKSFIQVFNPGTLFGAFQPLDATLTALAGLVTAADTVPYFTGTDIAALAALTSVGRDIIAQTTIDAVCQYLGLGSAAEHDEGDFLPSTYTPPPPDLSAYLTTATANSTYQKINSASKASNGWFKDSNTGVIIQWGKFSGHPSSVTFPIAFTTICCAAAVTSYGGAADWGPQANGYSATSFNPAIDAGASGANWIAIGY
ncbi:hypothetical protein ABG299_001044 [Salmonella enterica subsp. enterica]